MKIFDDMRDARYPYLRVDESAKEVRYLGYRMELTPSEYEVIRVLYGAGDCLTKSDISLLARESVMLTEKSVAVHVCSINKKSERLGGRKLIESLRKSGYFINKNS